MVAKPKGKVKGKKAGPVNRPIKSSPKPANVVKEDKD
jgi:hypothetical protein